MLGGQSGVHLFIRNGAERHDLTLIGGNLILNSGYPVISGDMLSVIYAYDGQNPARFTVIQDSAFATSNLIEDIRNKKLQLFEPTNESLFSAASNLPNESSNASSVLSNISYPTYNVNNTWANNLVTGAITGGAPTLAKNSFDYKFYNLGAGRYGVQEKGASKIDEITGVSSLKFADQTLTLANDVAATFNQVKGKDDVSGVVFRLYNAAFSRLPDAKGLENWINGNAAGTVTYASSAQSFSESQEFKNRYGSNVTDTQFITTLYNNVLGRAPDAGGLSHYQSLLAGGRSRGALLLDFSESPENRVLFTQVTGLA